MTLVYGTVEVPANGMLTSFVGLYATPDAGACLPAGEHRLEATYARISKRGGPGSPSETERWGFSLAVEEL